MPQYCHPILRFPNILKHRSRPKHPSATTLEWSTMDGSLPIPWSRVGAGTQRWPPLFFLLFPPSLPLPQPSLPRLFPDSLSPRNSGVDNSASHHGDGCLIWDECYITHCSGPPLIHQHLLLLSPRSADISALNASWSCCLLDAVRDYVLRKADGYFV